MNTKNLTLIVIAALLLLLGGCGCSGYNGLVTQDETVKKAWNNVQSDYQRRADLIPNLVNVAKGYLSHERQTLEGVIKARQMAIDATTVKDKLQAENILTSSLRSLMAVAENYPNLKADAQMARVTEELTTTENRIAFSRQYYNDEVNRLNVAIQVFPDSTVASLCKFQKTPFFELQDIQAKQAPQVQF